MGDKIYAFGGFAAQNRDPVADANVYDPIADRWTPLPPLAHALGSIAVTPLAGKLHLVGGRDVHSVGTHLVFDPETNKYTAAAPLPVGRDHLGLVAYDGKLYAIAGRIDDFNHNASYVDIYDPKTDRWAAGAAMPSQRSGMAVAPLPRPHPRDRRRARRRNLHQQRSVRPAHEPLGNPSSAPRRTTRHRPP